MTDSSKVVQKARNWPAFLASIRICDGLVDLLLGHVALVAVLDVAARLDRHRRVHDADRGHVDQRRLALELGVEESPPSCRSGGRPGRGGCRACRRCRRVGIAVAKPVGPRGELGRSRAFDVLHLVGQDALVRDLAAVRILALGEDRHDLVPALELGRGRSAGCTPRGTRYIRKKYSMSAMSSDSGWVDQAVDQRVAGGVLHLDLEAEILARLARDVDDRGVGAADLEQRDVLDVLRPDRREPAERARAGGKPGRGGRPLEHLAAAPAGARGRAGRFGLGRGELVGHLCLLGFPRILPGVSTPRSGSAGQPPAEPELPPILPSRRRDRKPPIAGGTPIRAVPGPDVRPAQRRSARRAPAASRPASPAPWISRRSLRRIASAKSW